MENSIEKIKELDIEYKEVSDKLNDLTNEMRGVVNSTDLSNRCFSVYKTNNYEVLIKLTNRATHKLVEEGKAVTPDVLSGIMENLFNEYFGDTLTMDELQKIVWSRIPHFFNSPYYVYQYATSFASSANLYDRITNTKYSDEERENAKIQYLTLLKSGGNDHPMNQLKKAGVDLEKEESFSAVAVQFNALLDILEEELNKINK